MPSLPFDNTRSPRFLKVFLPSLTSQTLGIPPAFWKHTNQLSTGTASLQGPSGNIWPVNLITKEGHTFFENGWQKFVRDHSIKCGNVLVFRYDGDSHFKVQVFDSSGGEKEDCFSVKPCEDAIMSEADGDTQNTRQTAVVFPASWSGEKNAKMKGRVRAFEHACSFRSNYPTVVVIIHDSYDRYLKLPNAFSRAHLRKMSTDMLLRVPKVGEWSIRYHCHKNPMKYVLSRGWPAFFSNNSLKVGDSLVLEVVHEREMLVHIFRA